jgi:lipoic acid synthetase
MKHQSDTPVRVRKPNWLRQRLPAGPDFEKIKGMIAKDRLHTVCQEAGCPNIWECFSHHTATFLIMGSRCTRNCRFCAVTEGPLEPPDPAEPARVASVARQMGLKYVVVTSVTRDDLPDGGARNFAETIEKIRHEIPDVCVEVLIPDFQGSKKALETVLNAHPDVLNHNIETVPRLYPEVRPQAVYRRSIDLIQSAREYDPELLTKSGLMLGLGEYQAEISNTLEDMLKAGCRMLTLGQYLQPSKDHLPVKRYIPPDEFEEWRKTARQMGFAEVASGPFVRSSYHARELFQEAEV